MSSSTRLFCFGERLGIYLTVQSSCFSAAAVLILLFYAFIRSRRRRGSGNEDSHVSASILFWNLMLSDLLQAIGNMPSFQWMRDREVTEGALCTAQAVIKQIGINGVALSSLCIALHTFIELKLQKPVTPLVLKGAIAFIWVFVGLVVGIPNAVRRNEPTYYGDTGYWCWIKDGLSTQLLSEYVWVWASAFIMAILYGTMFRLIWQLRGGAGGVEVGARTQAYQQLFYPAVYIICVFPIALARWLKFGRRNYEPPYQVTLFASTLFALSGLFNVILYFFLRRKFTVGASAPSVPPGPLPP
ncbi:hypothetical protein EST38_g11773 [Candolleomyces aberdarensis]|uniref:Uncharacterized protein n=1 Tax=Candolleomyces aberdarensis TaxID=2316362 RepID=A0A4Q2D4S2_9AGAR|nr:hypothetical protein EST38_g11773 [Candolleomyces aberdarensis]